MLIKLEILKSLAEQHNKKILDLIQEHKKDVDFLEYLEKEIIDLENSNEFLKPLNGFDEYAESNDGFYIHGLNMFDDRIKSLTEYKVLSEFDSFRTDNFRSNYGVCDNAEQVLEEYPELLSDYNRFFVVQMTPIFKSNQSEYGGWRWHKWGKYIGDKNPQYEYLYDEEDIDMVFCYHIYELEKK